MTKGKNSEGGTAHGITPMALTAIAGVITAFLTAYFGYRAGVDAIQIPLMATQTAEARLTAAATSAVTQTGKVTPTAGDKSLSIESMPMTAASYGGEGDPNVGKGGSRLSIVYNKDSHIGYILDYWLPNDGYGYAGLVFKFHESLDLSAYKFVEATTSFGDELTRCEFIIKDISSKAGYVPVGSGVPLSPGVTVTASGKGQTITILLETSFNIVNRKAISEMGLFCDTDFSRGNHTITVSGIKFRP